MLFLLSTGCFFKDPIEKSFYIADACGFDGVELILNDIYYLVDAKEKVLEFSKICPVKAFHAPFLVNSAKEKIVSLEVSVKLAEETGVEVVVFHPPMRWFWDVSFRRWFSNSGPPSSQKVRLCIENMPFVKIAFFKFSLFCYADFVKLKEMALKKGIDIAFDTTHCGTSGWDLREAFEMLGGVERVAHVHFSDFKMEKGEFLEHVFPGEGDLDMFGFLSYLADKGYNGAVTLEVSPKWLPEKDPDRIKKLKTLLNKMRSVVG